MTAIRAYASADAHVIYGTAYDDSLGDQIRVTVVATGLSRQGVRRTAPLQVLQTQPQQQLRTGTHDQSYQVPTLNTPVNSLAMSATTNIGTTQPDYHSMATPSVWRMRDRTHAAAKVDALASAGMDDFDIPAFLRKQAD
jgi:cell division protein FtsZ